MVYARRGQGLSHYYLGEGLLAVLRCCLGTIEAASGLFRSVSLSLRTACNAVAGHVLLAVLIDMTLATDAVLAYCVTSALAAYAPTKYGHDLRYSWHSREHQHGHRMLSSIYCGSCYDSECP